LKIEIYGVPCIQCETAMEIAKRVVALMKVDASIEHVTDMVRIIEAGVMMTPGIFINGHEKSVGRVPSTDEFRMWIEEETK
jgi:small redox-active disulfide protein 2